MYNKGGVAMKKTALYDAHLKLGAKMIEFGGTLMPLQYKDIAYEHDAVRQKVGIFDVSHMGELLIQGPDALKFANYVLTNTILNTLHKVTYALLLNENGFILDDVLVYVITEELIMLAVNAANIEKDFEWLLKHQQGYEVEIKDVSASHSQVAIQGPLAHEHVVQLLNLNPPNLTFMTFLVIPYLEDYVILSRTGYTGEDGYEIYGKHSLIQALWDASIDAGITPCGLGCRDTLRFEASLPLYGHEISSSIHPFEAGLGFAVKASGFIGSDALQIKKQALNRKLVGIQMLERGIPRADYRLYDGELEIGFITTGYMLKTQDHPIALAMVDINYSKLGTELQVEIRQQKLACRVIKKKFYEKHYVKES
jgi:aminomethyltransferase